MTTRFALDLRSLTALAFCFALASTALTPRPVLAQGGSAPSTQPADPVMAEKDAGETFHALGVALGRSLIEFDLSSAELDRVVAGLRDIVTGEADAAIAQAHLPAIQALQAERRDRRRVAEVAAAAGFLESEAAKKGAVTRESGLIITELDPGSGASPGPTDTVKVHYHGTLRDGTVFDSSRDRGEPTEFPLNRVIPCWTEGLGLMKVGGRSRLVCPASIAYGETGRPGIPGGAVLVFDVELLGIGG